MLAPEASRQGVQGCANQPCSGVAGEPVAELPRAVFAHLHLHAYEFSVAECQDGESLPDRYVMLAMCCPSFKPAAACEHDRGCTEARASQPRLIASVTHSSARPSMCLQGGVPRVLPDAEAEQQQQPTNRDAERLAVRPSRHSRADGQEWILARLPAQALREEAVKGQAPAGALTRGQVWGMLS